MSKDCPEPKGSGNKSGASQSGQAPRSFWVDMQPARNGPSTSGAYITYTARARTVVDGMGSPALGRVYGYTVWTVAVPDIYVGLAVTTGHALVDTGAQGAVIGLHYFQLWAKALATQYGLRPLYLNDPTNSVASGVGGDSKVLGRGLMPCGVAGIHGIEPWQIMEDPSADKPTPGLLPISWIRKRDALVDVTACKMTLRNHDNVVCNLVDLPTGHQSTSMLDFGEVPFLDRFQQEMPDLYKQFVAEHGGMPFSLACETGPKAPDIRLDIQHILQDESISVEHAEVPFSGKVETQPERESPMPMYLKPEVSPSDSENTHQDRWIQEPGCWIREHRRPRRSMFTPLGTRTGPLMCDVSVTRTTLIHYIDTVKPDEIVSDTWVGPEGRRLMNHKWVGRTVFQVVENRGGCPIELSGREVPTVVKLIGPP